jgi:hypothetical protein
MATGGPNSVRRRESYLLRQPCMQLVNWLSQLAEPFVLMRHWL